MNSELLLAHFDRISDAPDAIPRLRQFILDLAIRGQLVLQDPNDEPASELLKRIRMQKARKVEKGEIRKQETLPVNGDEEPFAIPASWAWTRLGQIGDWGSGSTPSRGNYDLYGGGITWLKSGELNDNKQLSNSEETVTKLAITKGSFRQNQPGDVLIAMYGATIGKVAILAEPAVTNQAVCGCTPFMGVLNLYLFNFLLSQRTQFHSASEGGAQPNISKIKILGFAFPLPPLAEQHRIVAKVDELMALCDGLEASQCEREARRNRLAAAAYYHLTSVAAAEGFPAHARFYFNNLPRLTTSSAHIKQLRQTILNFAFRGKLIPQLLDEGTGRHLLERLAAAYPDRPKLGSSRRQGQPSSDPSSAGLFEVPATWEWSLLGFICEQIADVDHKMPKAVHAGVPFISAKDLKDDGTIDFSDPKMISEEDYKRLSRKVQIRRGDIIYSRIGARLGKARLVEVDTRFLISYSCCLVRPLHEFVDKGYIQLFLDSTLALVQAHSGTQSIGVPDLGLGEIKAFRIPISPLAEQRRIVTQVAELMAVCDRLEQQLTIARAESRHLLDAVLYHALNDSHREIDKSSAVLA